MKLNGISVEQFGVCRNINFSGFCGGFNLVYGKNGSGKTTLTNFVKNVLYGLEHDVASGRQHGFLHASESGRAYRLSREIGNQFVCLGQSDSSQLSDSLWMQHPAPDAIQRIDKDTFDCAFVVDGRSAIEDSTAIARLLNARLNVPEGKGVLDAADNSHIAVEIRGLEDRIRLLNGQIADFERQKTDAGQQLEMHSSSLLSRKADVEREIFELNKRLESYDLPALRSHVDSLDREISELRLLMEQNANQIMVAPQPVNNELAILYRRLDEIDNQIRRWRNVYADVQQQRIDLKDEMLVWTDLTLDSATHPYHRSRALLYEIEATVGNAESTLHELRSTDVAAPDADEVADHLTDLCGQIRENLYALCDELGTQYKSLRHRNAAAELKRLRRCYHEISDNIEFLVEQHRAVLEEVRILDPAGAAAIARAENKFCECAQHQGYLEARRVHIGEFLPAQVAVPQRHDSLADKHRLAEMETIRSEKVRQLVEFENELTNLETQRRNLVSEQSRISSSSDENNIRARLNSIQSQLEQLCIERNGLENEKQRLQRMPLEPANPIMTGACDYVRQLTNNRIRNIWLSPELGANICVEDQTGVEFAFERLSSGIQQQVVLSMCLAIVEHYRQMSVALPMVLDDVFVNLDPELIQATFNTLDRFTQNGSQMVAMTSDQTVLELARSRRVVVFDLPETSVTPVVPMWTPERMPTIAPPESYTVPTVSYAPSVAPVRSSQPVESISVDNDRNDVIPLGENSDLRILGVVNSDDLNRLADIRVNTIAQLLQLNPSELPIEFEQEGLSSSDIDRWQAQAWLMMCVPELHAVDAQILLEIGVLEPEQLESTHCQQLVDRISRYLNSTDAIRVDNFGHSYNRERINRWYDSLGQTRSSWRLPSGYSRRNRWRSSVTRNRDQDSRRQRFSFDRSSDNQPRRRRAPNTERIIPAASRTAQSASRFTRQESRSDALADRQIASDRQNAGRERAARSEKKSTSRSKPTAPPASAVKLKFYLDLKDQLEAAPSIGPKTAERFVKIGVVSVGDFLTQTAESMAPKINYKRITVDVIRQWQHQARLVCRVPNLRGHDAQLLVACGIIEAEDLGVQSPNKLFSIIQPFAESKDGLKIIRAGKQPDLAEITDWINWAKQTRSLQAA